MVVDDEYEIREMICDMLEHGRTYGHCCNKGYMMICGNLDSKRKWEPISNKNPAVQFKIKHR